MSLKNKVLLIYCDEPETLARIHESLDPIHNQSIYSDSLKDVMFRVENQVFGGIIFGAKENLNDKNGLLDWASKRKEYREVPWIIISKKDDGLEEIPDDLEFPCFQLSKDWKTKEFYDALDELFPHTASEKKTLDPNTVNPIIVACTKSLSDNSNLQLERGTPYVVDDGQPAKFKGDLSIRLKFETPEFKSSVLLSFKNDFAFALTKAMKGSDKSKIDTEVTASLKSFGVTTFNKIQEGLSKVKIEAQNKGIEIHENLGATDRHELYGLQLCVPFTSEKGPVSIECVVAPKKN